MNGQKKMAWRKADDRDGSIEDVESYGLGWDGQLYVLHLGPKNRDLLAEVLAPWLEVATEDRPLPLVKDEPAVGPPTRPRSPSASRRKRGLREDMQEIRAWANANGWDLASAGRVPNAVMAAYDQAHQST